MTDEGKKPRQTLRPGRNGKTDGEQGVSDQSPAWLDDALHEVYTDVLNEPIPKDISDLLKKLDDEN